MARKSRRRGTVRTSKRLASEAARALRSRRSSRKLRRFAASVLRNRAGL